MLPCIIKLTKLTLDDFITDGIYINANTIAFIVPRKEGSAIHLVNGDKLFVKESVDKILQTIHTDE